MFSAVIGMELIRLAASSYLEASSASDDVEMLSTELSEATLGSTNHLVPQLEAPSTSAAPKPADALRLLAVSMAQQNEKRAQLLDSFKEWMARFEGCMLRFHGTMAVPLCQRSGGADIESLDALESWESNTKQSDLADEIALINREFAVKCRECCTEIFSIFYRCLFKISGRSEDYFDSSLHPYYRVLEQLNAPASDYSDLAETMKTAIEFSCEESAGVFDVLKSVRSRIRGFEDDPRSAYMAAVTGFFNSVLFVHATVERIQFEAQPYTTSPVACFGDEMRPVCDGAPPREQIFRAQFGDKLSAVFNDACNIIDEACISTARLSELVGQKASAYEAYASGAVVRWPFDKPYSKMEKPARAQNCSMWRKTVSDAAVIKPFGSGVTKNRKKQPK
ncbi:hypothetical protein PAPHI01_0244 [Pancytospora philotis]|nr:hypothetical protein PAPHI01_0244 [Pancytospora philotis]